jgi:putative ABC transport system ATP-binding protein
MLGDVTHGEDGTQRGEVALEQVSRRYGRGPAAVRALDGVTERFAAGSFTAIMGPSGSGKSTLLQCAAGLELPSSGSVTVDGVPLAGLGEVGRARLRRERIGFVFQAFNLLPALTAEENVALPARLAGRRPPRGALRAALAAVGVADRARHRPSELSGGEQQRVAVARALAHRPAVLFADEPTGALDGPTARRLLAMLRELRDREGQTIVMVTHDPVAAAHADRVVLLSGGRIAGRATGPTAQEIAARMARLEAAAAAGPC